MDSEKIRFRQRIINTEYLREVVDCLVGMLKGEAALFLQASGCVDANRQVFAIIFPLRVCFNVLKISHSPCSKL